MHFPSVLLTLTALIGLPVSIFAQSGSYGFTVSDCDGTNLGKYYGTVTNIDNPVCVPWPDGNFLNNERESDASGFDCDSQSFSVSSSTIADNIFSVDLLRC